MSWRSITITGDDAHDAASTRLIRALEQCHHDAGKPDDAEVFHRRHGDGSHTYYFSPAASRIASSLLEREQAVACSEPTGVDRLVRVRLDADADAGV